MRRSVLILVALVGCLAGVAVTGLALGALLPPTGSLFAVVGSMLWAPFGPFLLAAALLGCLCGLVARRGGLRGLGALALAASVPALAASGFILARIGLAAAAAGATVDLPATFLPGPMDQPAPDAVEIIRTVEGTTLRAAIYRPPPSTELAPVLVYVHGGGFMIGTFTETAADLRWFADRGWLVVSLEYRLFTPGNPTWDKAPGDVACGLGWVGQNAARLGGDPARIALLGDSAGGNLAINLGFAAAAGQAGTPCNDPIPVPAAIAVLYPAVDPLSIYAEGFPIPGFEPRMLIEGYIGGSPATYPERIAAVASASFLTDRAPPTLIVLPENDGLVVAQGTRDFVQAARAAGVPVELVAIPFANHVFNQIAAQSLGNQIGRSLRLRFLNLHLR